LFAVSPNFVNFDLVNGVVTQEEGAAVGAISLNADGSYRISYTEVWAAGTGNIVAVNLIPAGDSIRNASYTGDGVSGVYLTKAQLEQSRTLHDYVPSVTGPTSGSTPPAKQLVNHTNLLTHSNEFLDPAWILNAGGNITAVTDTDYFNFSGPSGTGNHVRHDNVIGTGTSATLVWSMEVKKNTEPQINMRTFNSTGSQDINTTFDMDTKTFPVAGHTAQGFEELADGWFRVYCTWTASGGNQDVRLSSATLAASDCFVRNMQVEYGTYPTAYINTSLNEKYGDLSGVSGDYFSTPDSAANSVTGDLELVCRVAMDDYTPAGNEALIAKWLPTGNERSYRMSIQATTGKLHFQSSANGTGVVAGLSTVALPTPDTQATWIRATLDADDGGGNRVYKFYTSTKETNDRDEVDDWTQLGATVTSAGATSIYDSTTVLEVGSTNE
jgi:hypothetical protein